MAAYEYGFRKSGVKCLPARYPAGPRTGIVALMDAALINLRPLYGQECGRRDFR
jgi:hypothetical protein